MRMWMIAAALAASLVGCATDEAETAVEQAATGLCHAKRLQSNDDFTGTWQGSGDNTQCCHPMQNGGSHCVGCEGGSWVCWHAY